MNQELKQIVAEVNKIVKGKDGVIRKALSCKRMQFTPDVLPS